MRVAEKDHDVSRRFFNLDEFFFWLPCFPKITLVRKKLDCACKGQFSGFFRVNIKIPLALLGNQMICLVTELEFINRVL